MPQGTLFHITTRVDWEAGAGFGKYRAASLSKEGFIHCSLRRQLLTVADTFYRGRQDLVLLVIDEEQVEPVVRYEDLYDSGDDFPHIYGPLNREAVMRVVDFPCKADGRFEWPAEV